MLPNQTNASPVFGENHTIETPEQIRLEFPIAGVGSRFLALSLDFLIQGAAVLIFGIVALIFGFSGVARLIPLSSQWVAALAIAFVFLLHFAYFAVFELIWQGQTPGKRFVQIRVIKDDGRPLSAVETIGRNLMRIVDQMPAFYAIGIVTMMVTASSKRLGDLVAGSIVVREASLADLRPTSYAGHATSIPNPGSKQLSVDEFVLVETFLARRHELPDHVRSRMASEILERFGMKLSDLEGTTSSAESVLENLAREQRSTRGYS